MKLSRTLLAALLFGYAFLFIPVALLVLTSFNDSRLTTVLSGLSFRWYGTLWHDSGLKQAGLLSLEVAALSATGARVAGSGAELEEAAMDLGCTPASAFLRITLPLLAPALMSGWLLAFTLSLDDLVVASFVSGPGASTLPMVVFSSLKLGATPELNALATVILVFVSTALIGAWLVQQRTVAAGRRRA